MQQAQSSGEIQLFLGESVEAFKAVLTLKSWRQQVKIC